MFDAIRKHQRILQFVLLLLILPAFVFFGISGYDGMLSREPGVARVGDQEISRQEFDNAQREQLQQLRQVLGPDFDTKVLDTPEARAEILENLISQRAVAQQASKSRIAVTDEQVRKAILEIPGLARPDGSFDDARYKAVLSAQNLTPAGFEARLRSDLALQILPDAVQASAIVPRAVSQRLAALQAESREVRVRYFRPGDYASQVKADDAAIQAWYDKHASSFETPERADVEFVVLSRDALAARATVPEDELKAYYEQNKARFGSVEERRASHILIKAGSGAKEKAEKLLAEVKADPSRFGSLARTASDDPGSAAQQGDLGFFSAGMMVKPFSDAVFAMAADEIRGLVESEFGYHIIRLTGIKPAVIKPFESVRAEIERDARQQQAARQFAEAAENFTNLVYEQADTFKPVVDRYGLKVQTAQGLMRTPPAGQDRQAPLANPRVLAAVFSSDSVRDKRNIEAIEIAPGTLVSARITMYQAAQRKPLDAVRAEVKAQWLASEAARMAREAGESRLAALRAGASAEPSDSFSNAQLIQRANPRGLAPAAVQAAYRIGSDKLPAYGGADAGAEGYVLIELTRVVPASAAELEKVLPNLAAQVARVAAQQDALATIDALKSRLEVKRKLDRLEPKAGAAR
ncbi:MAG: SurA N-terminal domain-containing protein [Burkholderiaceae bacterium]